jgi:FkbM family methyltransferase
MSLRWKIIHRVKRSNLLRFVNFNWATNSFGQAFRVPILGGLGIDNLSVADRWMIEVIGHLFKIKQGAFIDVGSNIGQTLMKVKFVSPSVEYIGFDPNPLCVEYCRELIRINGLENSTVVAAGLYNRNDLLVLSFYNPDEADDTATVVSDFRPDRKIYRQEYVPVVCFDEIAPGFNLKDISIIKIDVEGSELEVLQGLRNTIEAYRPLIMLEILPVYSDQNLQRRDRQQNVEQILMDLDYKILRVLKKEHNVFSRFQQLETIGVHSDLRQCDYVLSPRELLDRIRDLHADALGD